MMGVGRLLLVVSPIICNIQVTRMLVEGVRASTSSPTTSSRRCKCPRASEANKAVPRCYSRAHHAPPGKFVDGPLGTRDNYRTESITFHIAEFNLPYNDILGRPALVKFMVASHYANLTIKIPGSRGFIMVPADLQSSVLCPEKLYLVVTTTTDDEDRPECSGLTPRRARIFTDGFASTKEGPLGDDPSKTVKIGGYLDAK